MPGRGFAWSLLVALTLAALAVCEFLRLPAAPLLAGIAAGCFLSFRDSGIFVSNPFFLASQSLVGMMIARAFSPNVLYGMLDHWFLTIMIVVVVIILGLVGGWVLTVRQWLPGTTGIWGTSPGGAAPMTLMSAAYGGDMRLVAIMQYLRVVIVSILAVLVARFLGVEPLVDAAPSYWAKLFPPTNYTNLAVTLAVAFLCYRSARFIRSSAAPFLLPMCAGTALQNAGLITIELPGWLLVCAFTLIGWSIGLRFNRAVFLYAFKALPKILGAIFFMIGGSGILAGILVVGWDMDPLTAYLATSPGGADTVAIIAASGGGDMVFIMATQTLRLFLVLLVCPCLAKNAARLVNKRLPPAKEIQ